MRNISSVYLFKPNSFSKQCGGSEEKQDEASNTPEYDPEEEDIRDKLLNCQQGQSYILIEDLKPKDEEAILVKLVSIDNSIYTFQPLQTKSSSKITIDKDDPLQNKLLDKLSDDDDDDDLPEFHNIIDILPVQSDVEITEESTAEQLTTLVTQPIAKNWIPTYQEYFDTLITIYGEKFPRYSKERLAKKSKQIIQLIDEKDFHFLHGTPFQRSRNLNSLQFSHLAPITFETETVYAELPNGENIPRTQTQLLGVESDPKKGLGLYEFQHLLDYYSTAYSKLGKIPPKCTNSIFPKKELFTGEANEKKWKENVMLSYQKLYTLMNYNGKSADRQQQQVHYNIDEIHDILEVYPSVNSHYIPTKVLESPQEIQIPYAREGEQQSYDFRYFDYPDVNDGLWNGLPYSSYQYENTCVPIFSIRLNSDQHENYRLQRMIASEEDKKEGTWNYESQYVPLKSTQRRLVDAPYYLPFDRVDKSQIKGTVCSGTSHRMEQVYRQKLKQGEKRHPESWIPAGKEYSQSIRLPTESHQLYGGEKATIVGYSTAQKIKYPYHDALTVHRDISNTRFAKYTIPATSSLSLSFIVDNDVCLASKKWKPTYFDTATREDVKEVEDEGGDEDEDDKEDEVQNKKQNKKQHTLDALQHEKKLQQIHQDVFQKVKNQVLQKKNINNETTLRQYLSRYYEDHTSLTPDERNELYQNYSESVKKEEAQLLGIRQLLEQPNIQDSLGRAWQAISRLKNNQVETIEYIVYDLPNQVLYRLLQKLQIVDIFSSPEGSPILGVLQPYHLFTGEDTRQKTRQIKKIVAVLLQKYLRHHHSQKQTTVGDSSCFRYIEDSRRLFDDVKKCLVEMSNTYRISNPLKIPNMNIDTVYSNMLFRFWHSFLDFHTFDKGDLFYSVLQQQHYQQQSDFLNGLIDSYLPQSGSEDRKKSIKTYKTQLKQKYTGDVDAFEQEKQAIRDTNDICSKLLITKIYDSLEELEGDNCVEPLYFDTEQDTLVKDYQVIRDLYNKYSSLKQDKIKSHLKAGFLLQHPLLPSTITDRRFDEAYHLMWNKDKQTFRLLSDKAILQNKEKIRSVVNDGDFAVLYQEQGETIYKRIKTVWVPQDGMSLRRNIPESDLLGNIQSSKCTKLDRFSEMLFLQKQKIQTVEAIQNQQYFLDSSQKLVNKQFKQMVSRYQKTRYYYESKPEQHLMYLYNILGREAIEITMRRHPKQKLWEYAKRIPDLDARYRMLGKIIQNEGIIPDSSKDKSIYWKSDPSLKMCCQHYLDVVKLADQPMEIKKSIYRAIDSRWIGHDDMDGEMCCKFCGEAIRESQTVDGVEFDEDGNLIQGVQELETVAQQRRSTLSRPEEAIYKQNLSYLLDRLAVIPVLETSDIKTIIENAIARVERFLPSKEELLKKYLTIGARASGDVKSQTVDFPYFYSRDTKSNITQPFWPGVPKAQTVDLKILDNNRLNLATLQKIEKIYRQYQEKLESGSNFVNNDVLEEIPRIPEKPEKPKKSDQTEKEKYKIKKKEYESYVLDLINKVVSNQRLLRFQKLIKDAFETSRRIYLKMFLLSELLKYLLTVIPKRSIRGLSRDFDFVSGYTSEQFRADSPLPLEQLQTKLFGGTLIQTLVEICEYYFKQEAETVVLSTRRNPFVEPMNTLFMGILMEESNQSAIEAKLTYLNNDQMGHEKQQEALIRHEFKLQPSLQDDHPLQQLNSQLHTTEESYIDRTATAQTQTYSALPYSVKETATGQQTKIHLTDSLYHYYDSEVFSIDTDDDDSEIDTSLSKDTIHQQIKGYFQKYCFSTSNMGQQRIFSDFIYPEFALHRSKNNNCQDKDITDLQIKISNLVSARPIETNPELSKFNDFHDYSEAARVDTIVAGIRRYFKYSEAEQYQHLAENSGLKGGDIQKKMEQLRRGIMVDVVSGKFALELETEAELLLSTLDNPAKSRIVLDQMKTMFCRNLTIRDSDTVVDWVLSEKVPQRPQNFDTQSVFKMVISISPDLKGFYNLYKSQDLSLSEKYVEYLQIQAEVLQENLGSRIPPGFYFREIKQMVEGRGEEILGNLERVWSNLFTEKQLTPSIKDQKDILTEIYFKMYRFILEHSGIEQLQQYQLLETLLNRAQQFQSKEFTHALMEYIILYLLTNSGQAESITETLKKHISVLQCTDADIQEQITQTRYERDRLNKMRAKVFGDQLKLYREFNLGNFLQIQDGLTLEQETMEEMTPEINGGLDRSFGEGTEPVRNEEDEGAMDYTEVVGEYGDD
jgi:hypothetical protein